MSELATGRGDGRVQLEGRGKYVVLAAAIAMLFALIAPLSMMSDQQADAQEWSAPRTVYIPETGHTLDQLFLDHWRENGGAEVFGNPITPEITLEDGTIVQYLEKARFEYYPNGDENGNTFGLGNIGEELRPFSLQRSVVSFTSTGASDDAGSIAANAEFLKAWMPVDAPRTENANINYIDESGHTLRYAFLSKWNALGGESFLGNPITEEYTISGTTYQIFERGQLAWKNGQDARLMPVGQVLADKYKLEQDPVEQGNIPAYDEELFIPPPTPTPSAPGLRDAPPGERWIEVDLTNQYLIAWQGDVPVLETYVSTGRPEFATPPGTYYILVKKPSEHMEGVLGGEYYNVPNVPDTMYFTNVGHAIHGTYWHNNFGAVMSHGCVNVPTGTSKLLYDWTPMGARVEIHY